MYVWSHLHRPLIKGEIILVFEVILPQHCRHAKRLLRRLLVGPEKDAAPQVLHLVGSQAAEAVASLPDVGAVDVVQRLIHQLVGCLLLLSLLLGDRRPGQVVELTVEVVIKVVERLR